MKTWVQHSYKHSLAAYKYSVTFYKHLLTPHGHSVTRYKPSLTQKKTLNGTFRKHIDTQLHDVDIQ